MSSSFVMTVTARTFSCKSIEALVGNFVGWRDRNVKGYNFIGTHWPVTQNEVLVGFVSYDGRFWPLSGKGTPPYERVAQIMEKNFPSFVHPTHGREYKAGAKATLDHHFMRAHGGCPHAEGSAECDAFYFGVQQGRRIIARLAK